LSQAPDRDPFAKSIIGRQAKEAEEALGDIDGAVSKLKEAAAIEDASDDYRNRRIQ
jgi:hypothetical protein